MVEIIELHIFKNTFTGACEKKFYQESEPKPKNTFTI